MAGKNDNFVTSILQAHCCVNDQSFRAAYPKIGMKKCYIFLLICFWHDCEISLRGSGKKMFAVHEVKPVFAKNLKPRQPCNCNTCQPQGEVTTTIQQQYNTSVYLCSHEREGFGTSDQHHFRSYNADGSSKPLLS